MASATLAPPRANATFSTTTSATPFTLKTISNNTTHVEDEFSSHFSLIEEKFPELGDGFRRSSIRISLGKKRYDSEIDIFGAEKYFSGRMDGVSELRNEVEQHPCTKVEVGVKPKVAKTSSCSESSENSRSTLLRGRRRLMPPTTYKEQGNKKGIIGVFRCVNICSCKKAVQDSSSGHSKSIVQDLRFSEECIQDIKEMGFRRAERVSVGLETKSAIGREESAVRSRRMSLSVLNINAAAAAAGEDDRASESSSDLFEIESLSVNSHPFFRPEGSEAAAGEYEPSEASIEWSVATASAANFSVASDCCNNEESRVMGEKGIRKQTRQQRPGLLLGCVSEKAVESFVPPPPAVRCGTFPAAAGMEAAKGGAWTGYERTLARARASGSLQVARVL